MPRVAINDHGVDLNMFNAERDAERAPRAFGQMGLRIHVEAAQAGVPCAGNAGRVRAAEADVNNQLRAFSLSPLDERVLKVRS